MEIVGTVRRTLRVAMVVGGLWALGATAQAPQLDFTLIAGGNVGDGGLATNANMQGAADVVYDAAGNLYVSQDLGNRIRRIAPNGVITTVVGGKFGFAGDSGVASQAAIDGPRGLAIDGAGNLYFSDFGNRRVRRVATNGVITTVAGNGSATHSGDGGAATLAGIAGPSGLAIDAAGNLYIADTVSHRVRKVTPLGTITTVAGTGTAGYSGDLGAATSARLNSPSGLDVDAAGNLYIADTNNSAVRRVATNGTITTVFASANMFPLNVAVDGAGAVYTGHYNACTLVRYSGGAVSTYAGVAGACAPTGDGGAATSAGMGGVDGIDFDASGNLVFADSDYARVRRITTANGIISRVAGVGGDVADGSAAVGAPLSGGIGISVQHDGDVLFADALTNMRIRQVTPAGAIHTPVGNGLFFSTGTCATTIPCPGKQFGLAGAWSVVHGGAPGTMFVADRTINRIFFLSADGNLSVFAGQATSGGNGDGGPALGATIDPYGMTSDASGNLYVADYTGNRVRRINAGAITTFAGNGTAGSGGDNGPATSAQLNRPLAVAVDSAGNVYVSEDAGFRVRKITPAGLITTIAGNGSAAVSGDGGLATSAGVGHVFGLAADSSGVYLTSEGRLRVVLPNGTIQAIPFTHHAMGLALRDGLLYVTTRDGNVFRAPTTAAVNRVPHDYNGDGRSDIAWRNVETGANAIWLGANNATQQPITGVNNLTWQIVGQGDFDADGKSDLVWRNPANGTNTIWLGADSAHQQAVTGVTNPAWSIDGVGDFDGDGEADLFWRNPDSGQNVIWRSGNAATQTVLTPVAGNAWQVVGVGDFDGDGESDLLWRNTVTGMNSIWRSGNSATAQAMTGVTNLAWKIQGVGDFDGDGKSDVFWRNTSNGSNTIWRSANSATQQAVVGVTTQAWRVVAVGDYDGDGESDLLWRNTANGFDTMWRSADAAAQQAVTGVTNQAWKVVPYEFQN